MIERWKKLPFGVRLALAMGLSWGALMMLLDQLFLHNDSADASIAVYVFAHGLGSLLYGVTMAVFLTLMSAVIGTRWGRDDIQTVTARQEQEVRLALSPAEALQLARRAIRSRGFRRVTEEAGGFSSSRRVPILGFGEDLSVQAQPVAGGVLLRIACRPYRRENALDQIRCAANVDHVVKKLKKARPSEAPPRRARAARRAAEALKAR